MLDKSSLLIDHHFFYYLLSCFMFVVLMAENGHLFLSKEQLRLINLIIIKILANVYQSYSIYYGKN